MRVRKRQTKLRRPQIALPNFLRASLHSRRFTVRVVYFLLPDVAWPAARSAALWAFWSEHEINFLFLNRCEMEPGGTRHNTKLIVG